MLLTAAVMNAGIGDLSLGLKMAGFDVLAAYEEDGRAVLLHRANSDIPVHQTSLEDIKGEVFPRVDLLALRFNWAMNVRRGNRWEYERPIMYSSLKNILAKIKPRALFFLTNITSVKNKECWRFWEECTAGQYDLSWKRLDVGQMTGFPVNEHMVCVTGILREERKEILFPDYSNVVQTAFSEFVEKHNEIDKWHYQIRMDHVQLDDVHPVLCWKNGSYVGVDRVKWDPRYIPLVKEHQGVRKMTHREVANLKGFPSECEISATSRQWLYKTLMYSGNVLAIRQIAGVIHDALSPGYWFEQKKTPETYLTDLFECYLNKLKEKVSDSPIAIEKEVSDSNWTVDFRLEYGSKRYYFEIKKSFSRNMERVCQRLEHVREKGTPILVVADEVPDAFRQKALEQYGLHIWSVENLLWLFESYPDIKKEFVAFLDYSIEGKEPKEPDLKIAQNIPKQEPQEISLKDKLMNIPKGNDFSKEYEVVCTEILKDVLGEHLTMWQPQKTSNDGLYRFDLCCKIKSGSMHDFFDTVKNHLNTKYIIFEFKNYDEKITQKEIYTTEKYLYEKALRKVAIIFSREGADAHALKAANGALREQGKLILCFTDKALEEMMQKKIDGNGDPADVLSDKLDNIMVGLEK